jgi:hypothetical protein
MPKFDQRPQQNYLKLQKKKTTTLKDKSSVLHPIGMDPKQLSQWTAPATANAIQWSSAIRFKSHGSTSSSDILPIHFSIYISSIK